MITASITWITPLSAPVPAETRAIEITHFEELFSSLRHYSSLRVRQLTIYVAVNGGLLFALFRQDATVAGEYVTALTSLGVLAALAFALLEVRTHRLQDYCRSMIGSYEQDFQLPQRFCDNAQRGWVVRGRLAVLLFIAGAASLWIMLAALRLGFFNMVGADLLQ